MYYGDISQRALIYLYNKKMFGTLMLISTCTQRKSTRCEISLLFLKNVFHVESLFFFMLKWILLWGNQKIQDHQLASWPGKFNKVVHETV